MAGKKVVVRRAVGAAIALVVVLAVAGPVAAGKKLPATTGDTTPPTAPTNLHATSVGQTSLTLAWDASTDNSGSFSYSVNKDGQGFAVPQGQTTFTVDWLSAGRTYTFYVTAVDRSLNTSGQSNVVMVTTLADTAAPPAPSLTGLARGPAQVRLTWNRVVDDTSTFVTYRVFANGARVTQHLNWYGATDLVIRHLTPSTTYMFTVQAVDESGNTSMSNAVTLTTEASTDVMPPSAPTNLRIVGSNGCPA